jgi:hypothetical protein
MTRFVVDCDLAQAVSGLVETATPDALQAA